MKFHTKCQVVAIVIVLLGSLVFGVALVRNNSTTPSRGTTAPLSIAYVQYQQNLSAGTVVTKTAGGHSLGYKPPPIELSKPVATAAVPLLRAVQEPH